MTFEEAVKKYAEGLAVKVKPETDDEEPIPASVLGVSEDDEGVWVRVKLETGEQIEVPPEDIEIVEKPKKAPRRRKKTNTKKEEETVADETRDLQDETMLPWDDEIITPEEIEKATKDPNMIPPGQYEFEVVRTGVVAPEEGRPGGYKVTFKVITAPPDVDEPENGWPTPSRLFRRWAPEDLDDGKKQAQRFDRNDLFRLIDACQVDVSGGVKVSEALAACVGKRVIATVSHRQPEGYDRKFQDIGRFMPVE